MTLAGLVEKRRMRIFRDQVDGAERVMIRFEAPEDLRDVGLLYMEQKDRPNDYYLYLPASKRVRRLPKSVAVQDLYGIDPEFLGFAVAETDPTEAVSFSVEMKRNQLTYRLEERALVEDSRFTRRITWIDADTYVPLRTEHRQGEQTVLIAVATDSRNIQGVHTPTRMTFERLDADRKIELRVLEVDYEKPIPPEYFATMALFKRSIIDRSGRMLGGSED